MKRLALLLLFTAIVAGCTTTKTVVDRVEVPVPYWRPPTNIQPLPERQPLESKRLAPEQAEADTNAAFQAVAEDIRMLLEENEMIRHLYEELVALISEEPAQPEEENP